MRFRASIVNVLTFSRIMQSIERLQKKCIMRFTEERMDIICNEDTDGGIQVWSQVKVDTLFEDYRIQSNANNEISLALAPEALLQALKSAMDASEVVMKLAKKNNHAVLNFSIVGMSHQQKRVLVSHDVRIDVLLPSDVAKLKEPLCPEPDIHIILPPLQKLRTVVDHMRQMSDVMMIEANHLGDLKISVENDDVMVDTKWTKCTIPTMGESIHVTFDSLTLEPTQDADREEPEPSRLFYVCLSIRSFIKFLSSHVVSTTTIACICEQHCIILYVYIGEAGDNGGVLTFYIPTRLND
ncbi:cell cycle checkpoint [Rickenella mellea]|uniref:Checkpoint protein n=1 Tax=Rickenella mellea TaxID=50990 RepID=A0A4Y7QFC1_9AGAM|nr:cell cycle checkpoint [Rickenella mellea]